MSSLARLLPYLAHEDCQAGTSEGATCTCGMQAALDELRYDLVVATAGAQAAQNLLCLAKRPGDAEIQLRRTVMALARIGGAL